MCSFLREEYVSLSNSLHLPEDVYDSTAVILWKTLLKTFCLGRADSLFDFNTFHHSPRYAFALDSCSRHLCILIFQVSHKIASNILYIDSIDNALGIRFYLYVLRIHLHMYTLDWLPITVGTRTFQEGLLYNRSIVPIWRTSIFC